MVYVVILTVGFETLIQLGFLGWLTWKIWKAETEPHYPLLTALPSAPAWEAWEAHTPKRLHDGEGEVELSRAF